MHMNTSEQMDQAWALGFEQLQIASLSFPHAVYCLSNEMNLQKRMLL